MISVINRRMIVPAEERDLGVETDSNSSVRVFRIPRYSAYDVDITALACFLDFMYEDGTTNETTFTDITISEEYIELTWQITANDIGAEGTVFLQIKANDLAGVVKWRSYLEPFYVGDCIDGAGQYTGDLSAYEALVTRCVIIENAEVAREAAEDLRQTNSTNAINSANSATSGALVATANAEDKITDVENRFNALTTEQQGDSEVIDARKGKASLKLKMDDLDSQLASSATDLNTTKLHINSMVINAKYPPSPFVGVVSDANYQNLITGNWYVDVALTTPATDNTPRFQALIDNFNNINVPNGSYFCASNIIINRSAITFSGNSMEVSGTALKFKGTNGILIESGKRLITVEDFYLEGFAMTGAAIQVSKHLSTDGSVHFLTIQRVMTLHFKYGLLIGRNSVTDVKDGSTFLWNCTFNDLKFNSFDKITVAYGIKIESNGTSNFGLVFNKVYSNGYRTAIMGESIKATFNQCNFGINNTNAVYMATVSDVEFNTCNFECDMHIASAETYPTLVNCTYGTKFNNCSFSANTDANVSFVTGGTLSRFMFINNTYSSQTGNLMPATGFFQSAYSGAKYSIILAGGNNLIPRPSLGSTRSLQVLDLERSILPKMTAISEQGINYVGETQYDSVLLKPVYWNGTVWTDATGHEVWVATKAYALNTIVNTNNNQYKCTVAGTSSSTMPTHITGTATDGTVTWTFVQPL